MKRYSDYAHSSISMSTDELFIKALDELFKHNKISYLFESGTYIGTGSTTTLAEALIRNKVPVEQFITVEADYKFNRFARKNLSRFPFVTPLWGLTVDINEAKEFLENDEAIANHENYPDIFIDYTDNPQLHYLTELNGKLSKYHIRQNFFQRLRNKFRFSKFHHHVFGSYLMAMKDKKPLILLDSAGGIGYLEFNKVRGIMGNNDYVLILDDINHLKHFRSYRDVKACPDFTILHDNIEQGWLIAKHSKKG
ncbi:hypothetical protein [Hufsiella ginkgonis]|uniref:Class I SAM-dependent methyltransferase n=1 Tax=Hufsiella ginkgonis TaxID=2695274 RepID=A0A7K1XSH3_9SPHI|nr:hypothetical protein [Hufsiella ginkgonis]MXV13955.1 hypothetical protein [Hufsiella ginkgonis]